MESESFRTTPTPETTTTDDETATIWAWTHEIATLERHTHLALTALQPPTSRAAALARLQDVGTAVLRDDAYALLHHRFLERLEREQALHLYPHLIYAAHCRARAQRSHPGPIFGAVARRLIHSPTLPETLEGLVIGYNPATFEALERGNGGTGEQQQQQPAEISADSSAAERDEAIEPEGCSLEPQWQDSASSALITSQPGREEGARDVASDAPVPPFPCATTLEGFWRTILAELEQTMTRATYQHHFHRSRIVRAERSGPNCLHLTIAFASAASAAWLQRGRLGQRLHQTLAAHLDGTLVTWEALEHRSDKAEHRKIDQAEEQRQQPGTAGGGREEEEEATDPTVRSTPLPLERAGASARWRTISEALKLHFPRAVWEQHFPGSQLVQITPLVASQLGVVIAFRSPGSVEWFQRGAIGRRLCQVLAVHLGATTVNAEYICLTDLAGVQAPIPAALTTASAAAR